MSQDEQLGQHSFHTCTCTKCHRSLFVTFQMKIRVSILQSFQVMKVFSTNNYHLFGNIHKTRITVLALEGATEPHMGKVDAPVLWGACPLLPPREPFYQDKMHVLFLLANKSIFNQIILQSISRQEFHVFRGASTSLGNSRPSGWFSAAPTVFVSPSRSHTTQRNSPSGICPLLQKTGKPREKCKYGKSDKDRADTFPPGPVH